MDKWGWVAVWGNGNSGRHAGLLETCGTREEACEVVRKFLTTNDNPCVGAWVCRESIDRDYDC